MGVNDEDGRTLAVSLYDITDLENAEPLIARKEVESQWSWSEANWDHRAFSVVEGAVSVQDADGVEETGLVLLPFSGYTESATFTGYRSAVQIFTFSKTTLTARGVMDHPSRVRRGFLADEHVAANLSETSLAFHDVQDPDAPVAISSVELAPNYTDVLIFGEHRVRVKAPRSWDYWSHRQSNAPKLLEVIAANEHPDIALPIATIEINANASIARVGTHIVAMHRGPINSANAQGTLFSVYDLSNPAEPTKVADFRTSETFDSNHEINNYPSFDDCYDCGYRGSPLVPLALEHALVFVEYLPQSKSMGQLEQCRTRARDGKKCEGVTDEDGSFGIPSCTYTFGGITCERLNGGAETCLGSFQGCTVENDKYNCVEVETSTVLQTERECSTHELRRYWSQYRFRVLDLSSPGAPVLRDAVEMPAADEGINVLARAKSLYFSYKRPTTIEGDGRVYSRHFIKQIDLTNTASPSIKAEINVPGRLLEIDGNRAYTQDMVYGERYVETAIARVRIEGDRAILEGRRCFADRRVQSVALDGKGLFLVSHGPMWSHQYGYDVHYEATLNRLSVLDATDANFKEHANVVLDDWASLRQADAGRALFSVGSGLLVFNTSDPKKPFPQAYFPTTGWPGNIVIDGDDILIAAGRYGLYQFSSSVYNLLEREE